MACRGGGGGAEEGPGQVQSLPKGPQMDGDGQTGRLTSRRASAAHLS